MPATFTNTICSNKVGGWKREDEDTAIRVRIYRLINQMDYRLRCFVANCYTLKLIMIMYLCLDNVASVLTQFHHTTKWINDTFFASSLKLNIYHYECPCSAYSSTIVQLTQSQYKLRMQLYTCSG